MNNLYTQYVNIKIKKIIIDYDKRKNIMNFNDEQAGEQLGTCPSKWPSAPGEKRSSTSDEMNMIKVHWQCRASKATNLYIRKKGGI